MNVKCRLLLLLLLTHTTATAASGSNWIDAISLTYGQDEDSSKIDAFRVGLQNRWEHTWFNGGAWYLTGYWDAELAYLDSDLKNSENNELFDLSLTPVLRLQRDAQLSSGVTPYAEAGIGTHLITDTRLGQKKYSTAFQFGSLVGFGLGFGEHGQYELGYRFQHISNADIKTPNDGINLHLLRLGYLFY
jgi:opacity protein-like surface antigen